VTVPFQLASTTPLTPDFYDYPWRPIASADINAGFVDVSWGDGTELRAHAFWLRENIVAEGATDPTTREGTIDPAGLPTDLSVEGAAPVAGALHVSFSDGFAGSLHPGWLRHVADGAHRADAWLPSPQQWTADTLAEPPTFAGQAVLRDDDALRLWLESLVRHGIGRLEGLASERGTVLEVARRIGAPRETNFGLDWDVKAEIHTNAQNSTANTGLRLGPHTDLPTREVPPGFQFLHCISNTASGGGSTMSDGAAIAAHLEAEESDIFDALTTLRWVFFNRSREHDHRFSGPMLDYGGTASHLTIRAFYPVRAFPDMAAADIPRAYRAAQRFHELAADPRFQIDFQLRAGDLVGFDNRRLVHGRHAFETGSGRRHLRGCYVDHDEVHSRLRVLERRRRRTPGPISHRRTPAARSQP